VAQKHRTTMSGPEYQRSKEADAATMQEKQRKGMLFDALPSKFAKGGKHGEVLDLWPIPWCAMRE
jgi:hypothetical protein